MSLRDYCPPSIRITHIPTGEKIVSQHKSSNQAFVNGCKVLNAKIEAQEKGIKQNEEVVRDYIDYSQDRYSNSTKAVVVDHRIKNKLFNMEHIFYADESLDELFEDLKNQEVLEVEK